MKISVLTPSYNQGQFIEKNIQSVLAQKYDDFEHIIIDGGSSDNTLEILNNYPHLKWISEKDGGQADALNKGLAMASGDIVGWINSDDYYQEDIFRDVVSHFKNSEIKWIIGNITYLYTGPDIEILLQCQEITYRNLLQDPDIVKQQGVFFRKQILEEIGGWNKDFYMAMDFDLWVRLSQKYTPEMIPKNYAYYLLHADQKSRPKNIFRQIIELNTILIDRKANRLHRYKLISKKSFYFFKSIIKNVLIRIGLINKNLSTIPLSVYKANK